MKVPRGRLNQFTEAVEMLKIRQGLICGGYHDNQTGCWLPLLFSDVFSGVLTIGQVEASGTGVLEPSDSLQRDPLESFPE